MSSTGQESVQEPEERSGEGRVSFLDQALWKHFNEAKTPEEFARAWLAIQCVIIANVRRAVVVLGEHDQGPFAPAAQWPDDSAHAADFAQVTEMALQERRGVVQGLDDDTSSGPQRCQIAYPFMVAGKMCGAVAIEVPVQARPRLRSLMRQLQWGAGWIEVLLRREEIRIERGQVERTAVAFDLVAIALEARDFRTACSAVVTELAARLDCDQVSLGFVRRRRAEVVALSHAATFGRRMNLVRDIASAMDEAIDQQAIVVYPLPEKFEYRTIHAHAELARLNADASVLTIPIQHGGRLVGAVTFERSGEKRFDADTIDLCDSSVGVLGPILAEKRINDRLLVWKIAQAMENQLKRLLGPGFLGRKVAAVIGLAAVGFFSFVTDEYRVTSPATLEGTIQRVVSAPFDGYVASQHARAGDVVREGQLLAVLDDRDLVLERLRWATQHRERIVKYQKALVDGQRAEAKVAQAQIDEATARIDLLDAQIARTKIRAPFDGIVIAGDLSQAVGSSIRRGEQLFKVAPLNSYRVVLEVDEAEIAVISAGQRGYLRVSAIPDEPMLYVVERITPITESKEGRNTYRVEARLDQATPRLRPGMTGVGKTVTEDRLLIRIWTQKLIDWARLFVWRWIP
jgi:RND family efflux transporter MFP subunit